MENDKSLKRKRLIKGIMAAVLALCSIYSWTLPINSNFCKMPWLLKTAICSSISCGVAFYVIVIFLSIQSAKKNKKYYYDILYASPLLILETINILTIINHELWGHKALVSGLALLLIMFIQVFASIRALFKKSFGQENTPVVLISLTIILFVLAAVNEGIGNIEPANLCYKICLGLTYLVAIALYAHEFIYKPKKSEKIVSTIIWLVLLGATITITFPYYIQWCGLTGTNFESFVSIYAAVLGGGITLAGVAWTIKDANDKRQEDLKRIESERKEEERAKNIPYIKIFSALHYDEQLKIRLKDYYDYNKPSDRMHFENNKSYSVQISSFGIKNISNTHLIFDSVHINGNCYPFSGILIEKDKTCMINICDNSWLTLTQPLQSIKLIIHDMIGNNYSVECKFIINPNIKPETGEETTVDGEKYYIVARSYVVQKVLLPKYLAKGDE